MTFLLAISLVFFYINIGIIAISYYIPVIFSDIIGIGVISLIFIYAFIKSKEMPQIFS